ncbi:MAG TPA: hypothetical protein VD861_15590 [Pyrinomonadaceae bacterium]|nr:hypothetical protein [Pyrinomonadaceae bacterium]
MSPDKLHHDDGASVLAHARRNLDRWTRGGGPGRGAHSLSKNGYYADAVGLATVVLPTGWVEAGRPTESDDKH